MKSGLVEDAENLFDEMPSRNVVTWNTMINGYFKNGKPDKAFGLLGLVEQGRYYFDYMKNKCSLQPTGEHYTCIVDLLGRFGLIEEATSFIDEMREVPVSVWGALLGACRVHRNFEVGVIAAENVLAMEPDRSGTYLILAEMYASIGRRNDAERVLDRMKNSGVKKQPGCSWIEMNDCGHVFLSGDKSHLEFCRMNQLLEILHMDVDAATNASSLDRIEA
ncbi:Pentatricopeptide repeat-containing protein At2g13600 [Linum perenne]